MKSPNFNTDATKWLFPAAGKAQSGALLSSLRHSEETSQTWKSGNSSSLGGDIQEHIHPLLLLLHIPRNKNPMDSPILDKQNQYLQPLNVVTPSFP